MAYDTQGMTPEIRKLCHSDLHDVITHLMDLDEESRYLRFGTYVSDRFIEDYARRILEDHSLVFGAFSGAKLVAIGEIRGFGKAPFAHAEAALSVDCQWQGKGVGKQIFEHLVCAAQERGVHALHVVFLRRNERMWEITRDYHPQIEIIDSEIEATFDPHPPSPPPIARDFADSWYNHMPPRFQTPPP